jgi:hypothetical protein
LGDIVLVYNVLLYQKIRIGVIKIKVDVGVNWGGFLEVIRNVLKDIGHEKEDKKRRL